MLEDVSADRLGHERRIASVGEQRDKFAVASHEVDQRSVIDKIFMVVFGIIQHDLVTVHAIRSGNVANLPYLTRQTDEAWVKMGNIVRQFVSTVTRWIDRYKKRLYLIGEAPQVFQSIGHPLQPVRAYIRTRCVAEKYQQESAAKFFVCTCFAVVIL